MSSISDPHRFYPHRQRYLHLEYEDVLQLILVCGYQLGEGIGNSITGHGYRTTPLSFREQHLT